MLKSFVFKKANMSTWAVLLMPFGTIKGGFETKDEAIRWSNCANGLLNHLKHIIKEKGIDPEKYTLNFSEEK